MSSLWKLFLIYLQLLSLYYISQLNISGAFCAFPYQRLWKEWEVSGTGQEKSRYDASSMSVFTDSMIPQKNCLELYQNEQNFKVTRQSVDTGYPVTEVGLSQGDFLQVSQSLEGLADIASWLTAFPETLQNCPWREIRITHQFPRQDSDFPSIPKMCVALTLHDLYTCSSFVLLYTTEKWRINIT